MSYSNKKIRNYDQLINKGDFVAREKVLNLIDAVLNEVDAGRRIREIMKLEGDVLTVGCCTWDLRVKGSIYLIGAGKACNAMASAVCDILGDRITKGIISVKIVEESDSYVNTEVFVGGHPLPNLEGLKAAQQIIDLINAANPEDLFISVTSGGSSALLAYPVEDITFEDEILAQDLLLKSGAKIVEINAVRRHISRTNGGRLAELICNKIGAELISLMVSDGVGSNYNAHKEIPSCFSGTPFAADATTIIDARNMIVNYDLMSNMPKSIINFIMDDSRIKETPKFFDRKLKTFIIGSVVDSCDAAINVAREMNIPILTLTSHLEGESREAGIILSSIAREIKVLKRPIEPPCFIVCSGETTTTINSPIKGNGGPSQELILGFCIGIKGYQGVAAASIDTEGTDGTTQFAGAICDSTTFTELEKEGINAYEELRYHSSGDAFQRINDSIFTGNTGTNLCDFNVIYVG